MNTIVGSISPRVEHVQRNIGLDVTKGVAALLVCMLHFLHVDFGVVNSNTLYIPNLTKIIYGICACSVPLFFMINGTLMLTRECSKQKLLNKIFNLIKIRFVWGGVIGLAILVIQHKHISFGNLWHASFYLWFFEALAVIYIFLFLWYNIKSSKWSILIPVLLFVFPFLTNFIGLCIVSFGGDAPGSLGHSGFFRLYGILYFLIPFYLQKIDLSKLMTAIIILSGLCLIAFEVFVWSNYQGYVYEGMNACFPTIGAMLITIGVYHTFTSINYNTDSGIVKYFSWCGRNCMGIYLFHMPIIVIANLYLPAQNFNLFLNITICLIITTMSAYIYEILKLSTPLRKSLQI